MDVAELSSFFISGGHAVVDLTSHCNLRCTYCHQSQESFTGAHTSEEIFDNLFAELVSAGIKSVRFGTEGEFTMYKGWERYAAFLTAHHVDCSYLTNLSRHLSDLQITALASASSLIISFDSYDQQVQAMVRRRSKTSLILSNIERILERGRTIGLKPHINHNCVVTAHNYTHVPEIVSKAPYYGIDKVALLFMIKNFALDDGGVGPIPVDQMSEREQSLSIALVDAAVRLGSKIGVEVALSTIFTEKLDEYRAAVS